MGITLMKLSSSNDRRKNDKGQEPGRFKQASTRMYEYGNIVSVSKRRGRHMRFSRRLFFKDGAPRLYLVSTKL